MTDSTSGFSIEALTLPHEDLEEHRRLYNQWIAAYPARDPIEQGYTDQAVTALIDKRRSERLRATARTDCVRTALLFFDREQEDYIAKCMKTFSINPELGLRMLTYTAAGCRWAIAYWTKLEKMLTDDGTWYGEYRLGAITLQGLSPKTDDLMHSEPAYRTWLDCLVCNPNPKQKDINLVLDPRVIPKALQDRDVVLWPGDPAESKARLRAIVNRELPRLKALEATLRVQYELPARAEAQEYALAGFTRQELPLLRAERMHEQSYVCAANALRKTHEPTATAPVPAAARELDDWSPILPAFGGKLEIRNPKSETNSESGWAHRAEPLSPL